jgi:hypothetical protein
MFQVGLLAEAVEAIKFGWNELFCKPKSSPVTILCPNKSKINSIISKKWLGHAPIPQNTQFPVI